MNQFHVNFLAKSKSGAYTLSHFDLVVDFHFNWDNRRYVSAGVAPDFQKYGILYLDSVEMLGSPVAEPLD